MIIFTLMCRPKLMFAACVIVGGFEYLPQILVFFAAIDTHRRDFLAQTSAIRLLWRWHKSSPDDDSEVFNVQLSDTFQVFRTSFNTILFTTEFENNWPRLRASVALQFDGLIWIYFKVISLLRGFNEGSDPFSLFFKDKYSTVTKKVPKNLQDIYSKVVVFSSLMLFYNRPWTCVVSCFHSDSQLIRFVTNLELNILECTFQSHEMLCVILFTVANRLSSCVVHAIHYCF